MILADLRVIRGLFWTRLAALLDDSAPELARMQFRTLSEAGFGGKV
jgi:hypothetical protein